MQGLPNVVRRGGHFYFRRQVPKHLSTQIRRREIVVTLRTSDVRLGRVRSRYAYLACEHLFASVEQAVLSDEAIAILVRDFYDLLAQIDNVERFTSPPLTNEAHAQRLADLSEHRTLTKEELGRGDYAAASIGAEVVSARAGLTLDAIERRQLEQALMRARVEAVSNLEARLAGDYNHVPVDPLVRAAVSHMQAPQQPGPLDSKSRSVASPAASTGTVLSALIPGFLDHQRKGRLWDEQTLMQAGKSYRLFAEICGDKPLSDYDRASAREFKETLQDLPADYGKAALFRDRSLQEIRHLDAERLDRAERLSSRTVKRHFSALSGFWRWAIAEKLATENPFAGFSFPSALRANEQRDMWTTEELEALFSTPVWTGCQSAVRRSVPGSLILRDEKFWLPLIAVYSGLRQEEAAQLRVEDVRRVDGHWVFDINGRPPRKLKNRNAVRKVPVHSALIQLGLLEYIEGRKAAGTAPVFPNLSPGGADQRLGHAFSKWFVRYRRDVGLYRKGLDFHSFRHTATTLLQRAGVSIATIDELTGHATTGETARYTHGLTLSQLADAVERIVVQHGIKLK